MIVSDFATGSFRRDLQSRLARSGSATEQFLSRDLSPTFWGPALPDVLYYPWRGMYARTAHCVEFRVFATRIAPHFLLGEALNHAQAIRSANADERVRFAVMTNAALSPESASLRNSLLAENDIAVFERIEDSRQAFEVIVRWSGAT